MPVLDESERAISDSAAGFIKRVGGLERVRRFRDAGAALDRETWQAMADIGWLGAMATVSSGGLDLSARDMLVLLEAIGRSASFEPLASAIAAGHCLSHYAPGGVPQRDLIAGQHVIVPMRAPDFSAQDRTWTGASQWGIDAGSADTFLVGAGQGAGSRLVLVPRQALSVTVEHHATVDGGSTGRLHFDRAPASQFETIAEGPRAQAATAAMTDLQRLGHAAELTGLAASAFDTTIAYLKMRTQFGVPIGSFQALQHRAATGFVRITAARALLHEAARAFQTPRQSFAAAGALLTASEMAIHVTKECVQMHGAIGFTNEYQIGFYLKRAMALAATTGDAGSLLDEAAGSMTTAAGGRQ